MIKERNKCSNKDEKKKDGRENNKQVQINKEEWINEQREGTSWMREEKMK